MNGHSNASNFNQTYENSNSYINANNQGVFYPPNYHNNLVNNDQMNKINSSYSSVQNYGLPTVPNHYPPNNLGTIYNNSSTPHNFDTSTNFPSSNAFNNSYLPNISNNAVPNPPFQNVPNLQHSTVNNSQVDHVLRKQEYQNYYPPGSLSSSLSENFRNMHMNSSFQEKTVDLMQKRNLFTEDCNSDFSCSPKTNFPINVDPKIMQCTLNTIPVEANLLSKSRLPLGVHIQPFKDSDIITVSTNSVVRCRPCRTYINPFVTLTDNQRRWHCNVCGKVNDIPDEFMYDPTTKSYGNPSQRPELKFSSIEYTANSEYTVRPPMCTMYVFLLDVSKSAISSGYLSHACKIIAENLNKMPGDSRTQIAFFSYSSCLNFYQIRDNSYKTLIWTDIDEVELPLSEDLLVNLQDRKDIILEFLENLPSNFEATNDSGNCLGFAIQVAMKLISHNGGRVTIINASLPNVGPGELKVREYKDGDLKTLQPATDFYKSLALQCANDQISVDLFFINRQYSDLASISAVSRHSSGCMQYYGSFRAITTEGQRLEPEEQLDFDRFTKDFTRYLTRKIGFEAVMRTRFTKGLDLTAFHGNLFMRSTNVIALPVVNPDNSYLIQFKINNSLSEWNYVIIQSALLYTTSESDRRIRVHTMCLPISNKLEDIFLNTNGSAITGLITKIAVDKCVNNGFSNVREAFVNSLVDPLKAFNSMFNQNNISKPLLCPINMRYLAPFVLGLLRHPSFRGNFMNIDERIAIFEYLRSLPLFDILHRVYPYLVPVNQLSENISLKTLAANTTMENQESSEEDDNFAYPIRLNLTSSVITRDSAFLMDTGSSFYLFLGSGVSNQFMRNCFNVDDVNQLPRDGLVTNLDLNNTVSKRILKVKKAIANRSMGISMITVLPDSKMRGRILNYLVEDRMENSMSYFEFLKSIQSSVYS